MRVIRLLIIVVVFMFFFSCQIEKNTQPTKEEPSNEESFFKLYDLKDTSSYLPYDIKQTSDGGYLILALRDNNPYLLKTDREGNFLQECINSNLENYAAPLSKLIEIDGKYCFFATPITISDNNDYKNFYLDIVKIEEDNTTSSQSIIFSENLYNNLFDWRNYKKGDYRERLVKPYYAKVTRDGNIILLASIGLLDESFLIKLDKKNFKSTEDEKDFFSNPECRSKYPAWNRKLHITGVSETFSETFYQTYSAILTDVNGKKEYLQNCPSGGFCFFLTLESIDIGICIKYPFLCLKVDDSVQGPDGLKLHGAYINDNNITCFSMNAKISNNSPYENTLSMDKNYLHPELFETKSVFVEVMNIKNREAIFFAGTSKDNKIVIYAYLHDSQNDIYVPKGTEYLGDNWSYEATDLIKTLDGGIAILGQTYVVNRLSRICLFKVPKSKLTEMCGLTQ